MLKLSAVLLFHLGVVGLLFLQTKYDLEEIKAFIALQQAAMAGHVKQESRQLKGYQQPIDGD